MDQTEGRLSLAVLLAGAALVLAAGGAWWVAADPERDPAPEPSAPVVVLPERVLPEQVAPEQVAPEQVAPEQVAPERELPEPEVISLLPELPDTTVVRHSGYLDPGGTHLVHARTREDGRYTVQYACLGAGDLSVLVHDTAEGKMLFDTDCGGNIYSHPFVAAGTDTVVEISYTNGRTAQIAVQVIVVS